MDRRAPNLESETPDSADAPFTSQVEAALEERHGASLVVQAREGKSAFVICAVMPVDRRAHEVFVFARGRGARERAVDHLDGLVADLVKTGGPEKGRHLPLDWEGRPWDGDVVFVRGEVRDYAAEEEAAKLLQEPAPPRGLDRANVH